MDVGRWLEEFHPRSLVELDYGGLVHALSARSSSRRTGRPPTWPRASRRCSDGDGERAGEAYERLTERWRAVRERQFAS